MSNRSKLISWLRNHIPAGHLSYSQEGEDRVLARLLGELSGRNSAPGFFVDIGAHHPARFSNTYYFYRRGWRGINVDALPGTAKLFRRMRPRDITIECGVAAQPGLMKYFVFNEPALNTFSEQEASKKNQPPYHIVDTLEIPVVTLAQILDQHLPAGVSIDFMTIDVEGLDHEVIASNDWQRYRRRIVLVELLNTELENLATHPTAILLHQHGYRALAKTLNTCFFVSNEALSRSS